jgi:maleylacetate reductase
MIAIPSTVSGGEYNSGTLVTDTRRKLKQIFNHPMMMPRTIILDPAITKYTPEKLWLGSGTRAMDHGIEAVCSVRGNALVDTVCLQGLRYLHDGLLQTGKIRTTRKRASTVNSGPGCRLSGCRRAFQWEPAMPSVTFSGEPATCRIISARL